MNHRSLIIRATLAALLLSFTACGKQPAKTSATPAASASPSPAPAAASATPPAAGAGPVIESVDQKVSYGIGYNMGSSLGREKTVQVDKAAFLAGIEDGLAGAKTRLPESELEAAFNAMQQKVSAEMAAAAEKQLAAGKEYLTKNKARAGVTETASGLQYEVLKSGTGAKPKSTDTVKVHYHGTLVDGTVFDSSVERNEPIEFAVTGVIPGWVEALQLMSVGDKWKLTIPPAIAYGPRATGKIPANSVLLFEVELLGIK